MKKFDIKPYTMQAIRYVSPIIYPFGFMTLMVRVLLKTFRENWKGRALGKNLVFEEIIKQLYFTAGQAFWLITIFALATGLGVGMQISILLSSVGAPRLVDQIFYKIAIMELSPLVTAILILGRSGTAVTTELSTLIYNEEINSYKSMGINIYRFLVFPRLIGITFATLVLSIYFSAITTMSGAILVYLKANVPITTYLGNITSFSTIKDIAIFLVKNAGNGIIITTICCIIGMSIKPSLTEIPRAVSKAMVHSLFGLLAFGATMAVINYI